ncbi:peptidoglycan DD-metalloendopeptidase family protein [Chitinimonas sp.]|uniref:peptidoglycan DD-metalloendopeptidase family protein n=1 Tax=Chitinimonas sp. TaxID=1934313 RepID=UPI002F9351AF
MQKFALTPLALLLASLTLTPALAAPPRADTALQRAASAALAERALIINPDGKPADDSVIDIHKQSGDWLLGSVTQVLYGTGDDVPLSRLFLAHKEGGQWVLGLEGSEGFFALLDVAPASVLSYAERSALRAQRSRQLKLLAQPDAEPAGSTGLSLPWAEGVAWYMGGGPHGNSGNSRPFDSIDFSGPGGQVLAPRDGRIYKSCVRNGSAIVQLVHDNGYTSRYYHMESLPNLADGSLVRKGSYLGQIGLALPCGGSTTGPHVHFSLSMNGNPVAVNGKIVGGWQFFEGASAYQGYALHNSTRVNPGGRLVNYGAGDTPTEPGQPATVKALGSGESVNVRSNPSLQASIVTTLRNGTAVRIVCHAYGDAVNGNWGSTTLWDRLDSGGWVSDGLLDTGSNQPVVPACTAA